MISTHQTISIPLSKGKMLISLILALGFVGLSIYFLSAKDYFLHIINSPVLISIVGIAGIIFFGFSAIIIIRKLLVPKEGLIINSQGITDNSSGVSAGFIPWDIIVEIKEVSVMNQKFVSIQLNNPEKFIASQQNNFIKKVMTVNHEKFGSAVSISANNLKTNHVQLLDLLQSHLKQYNQITQNN
ncbi:hypothetical protein GV828_11555 [Flavobacterium sp. NST-5]|uniref:Band 7 domain-containing protein n=1 Tax=Flavobacterium ichthyis TaxID=2698827 RepID=A0ABW9ZAB6_9FLAO|nr:STM3941 family protein [Flavobacterium ichthyis]NBL65837.1 hypothetical protein [Flavobacterium ichthyis]